MGAADFNLRPERWPTRSTLPMVERVLREPLGGPREVDALERRLVEARGSAGVIEAGFKVLGVVPARGAGIPRPAAVADLPPDLAEPLARLLSRLVAAHADLERAVASLTPEERVRARRAAQAALGGDPILRPEAGDFDVAGRFDLPRLAAAGIAAARAVDEALPALERARGGVPADFAARWDSPIGTVLVSAGDAEYSSRELEGAGLLVRLGGKTRYRGPVAAAGEGQLRVVVDLGGPAVIESTVAAAGSGDFGIGLLYISGDGPHSVDAGESSLGAARFGVGYAAFSGGRTRLSSRRFGQGAAVYGVGALDVYGDDASLSLPAAGQGFGATLGAGLWRHRGAGLSASCGFEFPDAREELGFESLGQGAGVGPRAFAAGGVGAALVEGDRARLEASYFAQGSGYWRGLGALFVHGDDVRLQSRRYGLGSGVHAAVGALKIEGRRAQVQGWGVGPAFGWDYGVGLFCLRGAEARLRSDWATGRSDLGGRSLAWIEGDRQEMSLSGFGTGSFSRAAAGYGLAVIKGRGGRLRAPGLSAPLAGAFDLVTTPWGIVRAEGELVLDPSLSLPEPSWPVPDRSSPASAQAGRLPPGREDETPRERLSRLLLAASAQILDPRPSQGAARVLSELAEEDAPVLASLLDIDRFDELLWARLAAAGIGPAAAKAALREAAGSSKTRRAALLEWARFGRARDGLPAAAEALRDPDWRVRRQGAFLLAALFGEEGGDEPSRRRLLREMTGNAPAPGRLGRKRLADLYAALALAGPPLPQERARLLEKAGSPFDGVSGEALQAFVSIVSSSPARTAALAREEEDCALLVSEARQLLRRAARDHDEEVASSALVALGGLGGGQDAPLLASELEAPSAVRREAAALGLARLGPGAGAAVGSALAARNPRTRALAALAAAQSWDEGTFGLLRRALVDRVAAVRATALAGLGQAPGALVKAKEALLPEIARLAAHDPDASVRASAALAAAALPR